MSKTILNLSADLNSSAHDGEKLQGSKQQPEILNSLSGLATNLEF